MAVKAAPTGQLLKEYCNYTLFTGIIGITGTICYTSLTGEWPVMSDVVTIASGAALIPAVAIAGRSAARLFRMIELPAARRAEIVNVHAGNPREIRLNGDKSIFANVMRLAFDPTVRLDPDMKSRVIRYTPDTAYWDVRVSSGAVVRLTERIVSDIADKAWYQQQHNNPHPLSASKLLTLRYSSLDGRRLYIDEYTAFVELGTKYGFITGRRQGSSGRLAARPAWCIRMLKD